jgi:pimeloyl-ACP methyl ester carboxylesterase
VTIKQVKGPAGLLHVNDGGTGGMPAVLVHGFAGDSTHWSAQLDHLRKTRRAVAFDLRGHGLSEPSTRDDYEIEAFAEDIAAVVDALSLERFVLVGHSLGGAASLAYAGKHPERVAGLVLDAAPGKFPAEEAQQIIASLETAYEKTMEGYWSQLLAGAQPPVAEKLAEGKGAMPRARAMSIIKATFQYDPLPALRRYAGPKLTVITPGGDQPSALHKLVPDLPHQVITGTSHFLHMDKPETFNHILDEFLSSIKT